MVVENNNLNEENQNEETLNDAPDSQELLDCENSTKEDKSEYYKREIISWAKSLFFSFAIVIIVNTFLVQIVLVNGTSMQPTLNGGDKLFVSKINKDFQRGDVVVIENEHEDNLIKRVIATEGETIRIDFSTGDVFINEELLVENYIRGRTTSSYGFSGETTVPAGHVFVMGDNRNASNDSRNPVIGFIDVNNIFGVTFLRIYPFDAFGSVD